MKVIRISVLAFLFMTCRAAADATLIGNPVIITPDGTTLPSNTVATPAQITVVSNQTETARSVVADAAAVAASDRAEMDLYSTNYVVTSTVYVQSIGGVPYDPSNQTINICSIVPTDTNLTIVATVRQTPLIAPTLDWRQRLNTGAWTNIAATVTEVDVPAGVTNAAAAYEFHLTEPDLTNAFFRVVDNSSGASGSGLYWMVFGGIHVDGHEGWTGTLTNVVDAVTNQYRIVGGIVVEAKPLGGF